jgi:hypothetical protein
LVSLPLFVLKLKVLSMTCNDFLLTTPRGCRLPTTDYCLQIADCRLQTVLLFRPVFVILL